MLILSRITALTTLIFKSKSFQRCIYILIGKMWKFILFKDIFTIFMIYFLTFYAFLVSKKAILLTYVALPFFDILHDALITIFKVLCDDTLLNLRE